MQKSQPSSGPPDQKVKSRANFILALAIVTLMLIPVNCAVFAASGISLHPGEVAAVEFFIFLVGLIFGISTWLMANKDLRKIRDGIIPASAYRTTSMGKTLAVSATILIPPMSILIALVAFFTYSGRNPNPVIDELNNLSVNAYGYRIRPASTGGGGGVYTGYSIPDSLRLTEVGIYTATILHPDTIRFHAKWIGDTTTTITVKIGPDGQSIGPWIYEW